MAEASAIAETFSMDPVAVAAERDPFLRAFRIACHNAVVDAHNAAHKRASKS